VIPASFDYHRADSVSEALTLLREHEGAKLLAGGHSLIPVLKLRLSEVPALIDISRIGELRGIIQVADGWQIGALTTHRMLEHHPEIPAALSEAAALIGDPAIRNRGTVGGSLAHADPASDLPTVILALGATLTCLSREGERTIKSDEFFTGMFETALKEDELLVRIDVSDRFQGTAYEKLSNPASRYAMVGAAVALGLEGDTCTDARVAVGGLTPQATRCHAVETALSGQALTSDLIAEAAKRVREELKPDELMGDMHGSASYRLGVAPEIIRRALVKAAARAQEAHS
jgi:carbon-monoxide dehydrogenase medium subunit